MYISYTILPKYLPYLYDTPLIMLQIDRATYKCPKKNIKFFVAYADQLQQLANNIKRFKIASTVPTSIKSLQQVLSSIKITSTNPNQHKITLVAPN